MLILHIVLLPICVLLCALGNRWAGGLLSVWVGKDLGNTKVRILWGLTTIVPFFVFFDHLRWQAWWIIPAILVTGIVQGLLRGAGWGGTLTLGFKNGEPTEETAHAVGVMYPRVLLMNAGVWIGAVVLFPAFPLYPALALLAVAALWILAYLYAWLHPIQFPKLGLLKVDPPPTAEVLCGALTGLFVYLFAMVA